MYDPRPLALRIPTSLMSHMGQVTWPWQHAGLSEGNGLCRWDARIDRCCVHGRNERVGARICISWTVYAGRKTGTQEAGQAALAPRFLTASLRHAESSAVV